MVLKTFTYYNQGKKTKVRVKPVSIWSTGLMFRKNSPNLLFSHKKETMLDITSLFCKPFKALWLDENKRVIQVIDVKRWKYRIPGRGKYLLEIPSRR